MQELRFTKCNNIDHDNDDTELLNFYHQIHYHRMSDLKKCLMATASPHVRWALYYYAIKQNVY